MYSDCHLFYTFLSCLMVQKNDDIKTNNPGCNILLWTRFCFLQVNQQEPIRMVSPNNV